MQLAGHQFLGKEQAEEQTVLRLVVEAAVARTCQAAVQVEEIKMLNFLWVAEHH